jgi:hypothetical protein
MQMDLREMVDGNDLSPIEAVRLAGLQTLSNGACPPARLAIIVASFYSTSTFLNVSLQAEVVRASESGSPRGSSIRRVNSNANLGDLASDTLSSKGKLNVNAGPEDRAVIELVCVRATVVSAIRYLHTPTWNRKNRSRQSLCAGLHCHVAPPW